MRRIGFVPAAFEDFIEWQTTEKKTYDRVVELIKDTLREPFSGIGKPEALKYELKGLWSRRIDEKNRLVYKVTDEELIIVSCKFHY